MSAIFAAALLCSSCNQLPELFKAAPPKSTACLASPSASPELPVADVAQSPAIATLSFPWSAEILPDQRFLVTHRSDPGALSIITRAGEVTNVIGLPTSIGLLDVSLAPDFAASKMIYFSYMVRDLSAERAGRAKDDASSFPERMMVGRAHLEEIGGIAKLTNLDEIFRQVATITTFAGSGEPGGRLAFSPDGRYLFITSGDRQELDPSFLFELTNNIGKVIRLYPDGSVPPDNPFVGVVGARSEIWTLGHRNPYGLAFAEDGSLWSSEMGPKGGDEINNLLPGRNYGWPAVSNGDDSGFAIPDHSAGDGYQAPSFCWTPVIAPGGMLFYKGAEFAEWQGDLLLTGLTSQGLVRVRLKKSGAQEVQRYSLGARIRDITEGQDGSLWILTDGPSGELRRIVRASQ